MIQHDARHPETEQEQGSLLHATDLGGNQHLPQVIGLDDVVDPEAFSQEVITILTDIPADQEGGN
jgi:hypothetical protein